MPRTHRPYPLEFRAEAVRARGSDKSIPALAADLGIVRGAAPRLRQAEADEGRGQPGELTTDEREELQRLRREVRVPQQERDLAKSRGLLREGDPVRRYRFIHAARATYPGAVLCRVLQVARSAYYAWARHGVSARAQVDEALTQQIAAAHARSRRTYGAPRVRGAAGAGHPLRPQAGRPPDARRRARRLPSAAAGRARRSPTRRTRPRRTSSRATSRHRRRIACGSATSHPSPRGRAGSIWRCSSTLAAPRGRRGDGRPPAHRAGVRRAGGARPAPPGCRPGASHRPRLPVHRRHGSGGTRRPRCHRLDEPGGRAAPRQRDGRELLRDPQG